MRSFLEKALSWAPVVLILLLAFTAWTFLRGEGPEGGTSLILPVCKKEKRSKVDEKPFQVIYRSQGCGSVSDGEKRDVVQNIFWWERASARLQFPLLRNGTVIDIRPGPLKVRSVLGAPGAISVQPSAGPPGKYLLAKGLNTLVLREALPRWQPRTLDLAAGSLALSFLGQESYRTAAPAAERKVRLIPGWPRSLLRCGAACSPRDLLREQGQ